MKNLLIIIFLTTIVLTTHAQDKVNDILLQIELNNKELAAYKHATEAQKIENKTGIYLENPVVDAAYLWGNPGETGNRQDFSIMQSLNFITASKKGKIAGMLNDQINYVYSLKRKEILLQAKQLCIELGYLNAMSKELQNRLKHAETIDQAYEKRFENGDASIIDRNKAALSLLNARKELENNEISRKNTILKLESLNGGMSISDTEITYPVQELPIDFEVFYAENEGKNPELQVAASDINISKEQIGLNKAMGLPKLSAGYMLENVVGSRYQGIKVALTIPLWENKNNVKLAKVRNTAAHSYSLAVKQTNYDKYQILYEKAVSLQKMVNDYQTGLKNLNNADLLKKALDNGELNLIEYMLEIQFYYETMNKMQETRRDLELVIAELRALEL